jgi:uncharacterized protein YbcC (UPF0753/DUF2309 family)
MSQPPQKPQFPAQIKTGFSTDIDPFQKTLLLSLLGTYTDETVKTALIYSLHNGYHSVTKETMLKAMKYEVLSPEGSAFKLKEHMKEAMETGFITDIQTKPVAHKAVMDHMERVQTEMINTPNASSSEGASILMKPYEELKEEDSDDEEDLDSDESDEDSDEPIEPCTCPSCTAINSCQQNWPYWTPSDPLEKMIQHAIDKASKI